LVFLGVEHPRTDQSARREGFARCLTELLGDFFEDPLSACERSVIVGAGGGRGGAGVFRNSVAKQRTAEDGRSHGFVGVDTLSTWGRPRDPAVHHASAAEDLSRDRFVALSPLKDALGDLLCAGRGG